MNVKWEPGSVKKPGFRTSLADRGLNVCPPFFLCQKLRGD
ncbi:hypothetical protein EBA29_00651 [Bacillus velezensis]|uniref:Uncharacterized protein n=1 Tax=Bacillus amyloliquefaciens (strain Y2) TaxID=1155777 RepID=I2C238_BACAY|nr:hypothetical protein MUS_0643 [Bacillus velezensis YAU B9601-Y2]QAR55705.1 hypothetical protein EBA29_00651 [Bacillus velezensis]